MKNTFYYSDTQSSKGLYVNELYINDKLIGLYSEWCRGETTSNWDDAVIVLTFDDEKDKDIEVRVVNLHPDDWDNPDENFKDDL